MWGKNGERGMIAFLLGSAITLLFTIVMVLDDVKKRLDEIIEIMESKE